MKPVFAAGSFAFLIVLLLSCSPARAEEPDPVQNDSTDTSADATVPDTATPGAAADEAVAEAGEETGEAPPERFTVSGIDEAVSHFYEKTAEGQKDMMERALEGVNKLSPGEQHQLAEAQKERLGAMSPQQAEQEARDELTSMSPEEQESMRSLWEHQLQDDPDFRKLSTEDRRKALDQLRNFGKDVEPDIVMAPPGS